MRKVKVRGTHKVRNIILIIVLFGISTGVFLFYGPWHGFRDFWITTAMTTMNHQYLATWLYSDKTINSVLDKNKVIETTEKINTDLIAVYDNKVTTNIYKDEYDRQVLEHEEGAIYKYFKVEGYNVDAYMAAM